MSNFSRIHMPNIVCGRGSISFVKTLGKKRIAVLGYADSVRQKVGSYFADTDAEAGTVIAEELLEVNTAALKVAQGINDQADRDNLFVELAQLNATTIRMMEKLLK